MLNIEIIRLKYMSLGKRFIYFLKTMKKTLSVMLIASVLLWSVSVFAMNAATVQVTAANGQTVAVKTTELQDEKTIRVDPDYPQGGNITYNIDALDIKWYVKNSKPSLLKMKCDGKEILKSLWLVATKAKLTSIGVQEWDFTYNYDFNGCSFWASRVNYLQPSDSLTEEQAIKFAKDFLASSEALNYYKKMLWEPMILYRNFYDTMGQLREGKSWSITVAFPIKIAGKKVYQVYGDPLALTMEVNNKGVNSVNAQVLPFWLLKADSYKLGADDITALLKKWANQPYYTYNMAPDFKTEVKATELEKVWIYTQKWPTYGPWVPAIYLSSGIRVKTDKQIDNGPWADKKDYTMLVSDYKIGNNPTY